MSEGLNLETIVVKHDNFIIYLL